MLRLVFALSILTVPPPARSQGAPRPGLTGEWIFGEGTPEPKPGVVKRERGCYAGGVVTQLEQKGSKVSGTIRWYPPTQGAEPPFVIEEGEDLVGTREKDQVKLTGTYDRRARPELGGALKDMPRPVHAVHAYLLVYDPKTQHLVGTKDGKPFWAAPVTWIQLKCGPPPP